MSFSILEILNFLIYVLFVVWALRIYKKGWSFSTKLTLFTGAGLIVSDLLEHFVSETASIVFTCTIGVVMVAWFAAPYFKKPT